MKMYGSNLGDTLIGTPESDAIEARGGNDLIATAASIDTILAGDGDDMITGFVFNLRNVFLSDNRKSVVDGGSGSHDVMIVELTAGGRTSEVDLFKEAMTVRNVEEFIYNFAAASPQKQILGADSAKGLETIVVASGDASIDLRKGNDFVYTADGDDVIQGGKGSDFIHADTGHNVVSGGGARDYFHFQLSDTYQYTEITDFQSGVDKILITIDIGQVNLLHDTSYESPLPVRGYGDGFQGVGDVLNPYVSYNHGREFDPDDFTNSNADLAFDDFAYYELSTGSIFVVHYEDQPWGLETEVVLVAQVKPGTAIADSDFSFRMI